MVPGNFTLSPFPQQRGDFRVSFQRINKSRPSTPKAAVRIPASF